MAKPPRTRAITNSVRFRGSAEPKDEIVNNAAAAIRTRFLPKRSLVNAARLAPTTHPRSRLLAAISVCESVQSELALEKYNSAIDHCGVEAEKQTTDRSDGCGQVQVAGGTLLGFRHRVMAG